MSSFGTTGGIAFLECLKVDFAAARMTKEFPEAEFGPDIPFREYSFLDNPKANVQRADIVNVTICQVMQQWNA